MAVDGASIEATPRSKHPLLGLLVAQFLGAFNDNAWKQVVIVLAVEAVLAAGQATSKEAESQAMTSFVQVVFMIPLFLFSLPAGVVADRFSKRSVILAMKVLELGLMIAGTAALYANPTGGSPALLVLGILGIQAALFSPAKYGILPEILPHERLSAGNGLLEMCTNLAIIAGIVAGGVIVKNTQGHAWVGGLIISGLSAIGLCAAVFIPRVPVARAEGGLVETVRIAWGAVREDRILRLAILGQIFVWSIASLVPPPIQVYGQVVLKLDTAIVGLPLAALGIGIGIGCVLAGKLSASKVEYGLLPLGALGLTVSTLAFAVIGPGDNHNHSAQDVVSLTSALLNPGVLGTLALMGLIGMASGLLFVPLNALIQWRASDDRRGAVIALANVLVFGGMFLGSLVAMGFARAGVSARGTFLGASIVLAGGTIWALRLVPDAFLRFVLILLANTLYRLRVLGRENVPADGGALLTPNHVSFTDGLFLIASIDRPIRFVVYADYFQRPLIGPFLRAMRAIPISGTGGPKMILQAFREAGRRLDEGELVCIFPEGQITRTGLTLPFQRGLERIVKGRSTPIIPVHIDRASSSLFSPMNTNRLPERIPMPITVSFGPPLPSTTPLGQIRSAVTELDREAWAYRKADRRPLHHEFIRRTRRHPFRMAMADLQRPRVTSIGTLAGSIALGRALSKRWKGQDHVGILLPTSIGAGLVNLAATISGRASVNLNFTAGRAAMESAARQAGLRTVVTSRTFLEKAKLEMPEGVEPIWIEEVRDTIPRLSRVAALLMAWFAPIRFLEQSLGASRRITVDDTATIIFSSGSTGDPKGVVLTHLNIESNVEAIAQVFRARTDDRILDILPMFHSFGYLVLWLAMGRGLTLICHNNPLEAGAIGDLVQRHRATILLATPTFLQLYLRRCSPAMFGSLRLVVAGAEKLSETLARAFEEVFGIRPLEGYGMTECSPVVAVSTLDYRAPGFFQPGSRRGFIGHPLPGVSVRVVDPQTGEPLGPNQDGMIQVKGPNVMKGYLGRDDLTSAAIQDGWYVSGDIGMIDEDGYLKITGRLSRFSKIGGEMVPHGRVEEALQEAINAAEPVFAVTAVNDARGGERLAVLYTVDDELATKALEGLVGLGLPNLFIPRRDQFVKVDALPMLGTGKLDLRAVKRVAEERLAVGKEDRLAGAVAH
jgi:acyl-[acyl-carrier-protein]-phospholipid O-acyltransferase/long-chain-fatty-acid--[acyl-carrier-protein] ligase